MYRWIWDTWNWRCSIFYPTHHLFNRLRFNMVFRFGSDQIVSSDPINREPLIIPVLLTLRILLYNKSTEPLEPRLEHMVLRTVASFHGSHDSFLFWQSFGQYWLKWKFLLAVFFFFFRYGTKWFVKGNKTKKKKKKKKKVQIEVEQTKDSTFTTGSLHHARGHLNEPLLLLLLFW